jgi:hypothetical protein
MCLVVRDFGVGVVGVGREGFVNTQPGLFVRILLGLAWPRTSIWPRAQGTGCL